MHRRGSPELVQEVQTEGDLVSSLLAALVPLEDVAPVAANSRQCIPEVPVVHVVHRQNSVSLHTVYSLFIQHNFLSIVKMVLPSTFYSCSILTIRNERLGPR